MCYQIGCLWKVIFPNALWGKVDMDNTVCTISESYPFLLSHGLCNWVIFNMKSHCLHVRRIGPMIKMSTFFFKWCIGKFEASAGGARIAKWKNFNLLTSAAVTSLFCFCFCFVFVFVLFCFFREGEGQSDQNLTANPQQHIDSKQTQNYFQNWGNATLTYVFKNALHFVFNLCLAYKVRLCDVIIRCCYCDW